MVFLFNYYIFGVCKEWYWDDLEEVVECDLYLVLCDKLFNEDIVIEVVVEKIEVEVWVLVVEYFECVWVVEDFKLEDLYIYDFVFMFIIEEWGEWEFVGGILIVMVDSVFFVVEELMC